jgi:hypothetical protein
MKIDKGKQTFEPVVITFETKEELEMVWACMAVSHSSAEDVGNPYNVYTKSRKHTEMWSAIDDVCIEYGYKERRGKFKE